MPDHTYSARFEAEPGEAGEMKHVQCVKCRGVHFEEESHVPLWLGGLAFLVFVGISIWRMVR